MNTPLKTLLSILLLAAATTAWAAAGKHDEDDNHAAEATHEAQASGEEAAHEHDEDEEHEAGVVMLTPEQRQAAGIETIQLVPRQMAVEIRAPGEVRLNAYRTSEITPRVAAQVVARHAVLGDQVEPGQKLVTLSSVEMAEAQGALLLADREWRRVKKLGIKVASARRYTEAQVNRQLAWAKVSAYGMTAKEIDALLAAGDARKANGEFKLLATRKGTVIEDDFIEGEVAEPGRILMTITDEGSLWIEARLTPAQLGQISKGAKARVQTAEGELTGEVTQIHHRIDETTRTIAVRVTVANPHDRIHPGEFVDVLLPGNHSKAALVVPDEAVVRSTDGDWQVFVAEHDDAFRAVEVEVLGSSGRQTRIAGLEPGTAVVVSGAFFLQSELAKSGFDIHNH